MPSQASAVGTSPAQISSPDRHTGWPEHAPYDRIIATAAPDLMPPALLGQLKAGGRMIIPAGLEDDQQLMLVEKSGDGRISTREILPVRFSTMTTPS